MSNNFVIGSAARLINESIICSKENVRRLIITADVVNSTKKEMWNRCVVEWLKNLRSDIEYYDEVFVSTQEMSACGCYAQENLNFGQVCRVSVAFDEALQSLQIVPVVYECLDPEDLAEDVIMWKKQMRFTYCGEEEHFLENEDLITDCENEPRHPVVTVSKPGNFPLPEEEEVQVRPSRNIKLERPKTYAPTLTKKDDVLVIRGLDRLEIGTDRCVKIRSKETVRLLNGTLELLDDGGATKERLRQNVSLKRGVKILGKKELEIADTNRTIYRLQFLSNKEAKVFIDDEKNYHSSSSTSSFKNIGPWSQLRKLLKKRSSRDILESKGILKNEPIFGNTLEELCDADHPVPEVITKIIKLIEEPENITSVGLYRASANLAVVQNIRFEINCGRWEILDRHRNDVDVLTGTLKLFFRELKQPLVSYEIYQELRRVLMNPALPKTEIDVIIDRLPHPNKATLLYIIKHLLKVCQHKESNKMDFHNLSICWGPSLITLPDNCTDLVTQTTEFTKITEDLLAYYSTNPNLDLSIKPRDFIYEVIQKLTTIIETQIRVEGIYRKSGSNAKIDKIMKQLDKQNLAELDSGHDVHDLCCVLKKFVANARKSIVPDEFFYNYLEICDKVVDSKLRDEVRRMVSGLPRNEALLLLFEHLHKVVLHEPKNKMSLGILSNIWMTTLMAGTSVQNYQKKMPKYTKLFLILMNLNERALPDLVASPKGRTWSKYDNVPDDMHNDEVNDKVFTKL